MKVAEANENEQAASQLGTTLAELKERNALLKNLSAVYMRIITSLKKQASLKKEEISLDQAFESEKESMIAESPPFTLTVYDGYLDRLNEATQDEDIGELPTYQIARKGLGYVPENREIFPALTTRQNLQLGIDCLTNTAHGGQKEV